MEISAVSNRKKQLRTVESAYLQVLKIWPLLAPPMIISSRFIRCLTSLHFKLAILRTKVPISGFSICQLTLTRKGHRLLIRRAVLVFDGLIILVIDPRLQALSFPCFSPSQFPLVRRIPLFLPLGRQSERLSSS
jgi:hypothetical protein